MLEGDITTILFEDESMIRDYQAIMKTWFPKGKQRIIPTYGKHEGVKLVGFLNLFTGMKEYVIYYGVLQPSPKFLNLI